MTTNHSTDFWNNHINAWNKSGLSQAEYARNHQLSVKTFGYHKRRYAHQKTVQSVHASKESQPLIPVSVAQEPAPENSPETGIALVSPGGFRVELASGFDVETLKRVLSLLEVA